MKRIACILALSLSGCAGLAVKPLLPSAQRSFEYVEPTTVSAKIGFENALTFVAQKFGDSNSAIKIKDKESSHIGVSGNVVCNELRPSFDVMHDYRLSFFLDVRFKDKKSKIVVSELEMIDSQGTALGAAAYQITSPENLKKVEPCVIEIKNALVASLNIKQSNDF
jgi:hypothetical protein